MFIVRQEKWNSEQLNRIEYSNKNQNSDNFNDHLNIKQLSDSTLIEHKDIQSYDNFYNIDNNHNYYEEKQLGSFNDNKRNKSQHEIINQPYSQKDTFRRVESTSSFKRLPKISHLDTENDSIQNQSNEYWFLENAAVYK